MPELTPFRCPKCNQPLGFTNGSAFYYPMDNERYLEVSSAKGNDLILTCDCKWRRKWKPQEKFVDKQCKKQ